MHKQSLVKHTVECQAKMMKMEIQQQPASIYAYMHHSTSSFLFPYISQCKSPLGYTMWTEKKNTRMTYNFLCYYYFSLLYLSWWKYIKTKTKTKTTMQGLHIMCSGLVRFSDVGDDYAYWRLELHLCSVVMTTGAAHANLFSSNIFMWPMWRYMEENDHRLFIWMQPVAWLEFLVVWLSWRVFLTLD